MMKISHVRVSSESDGPARTSRTAYRRPKDPKHIHFNHSMRGPAVVIPVTAVVGDDGLVPIEGDDLFLVRWNHRPTLLRAALQRFGGRADWKPRWYLLAVPIEAFMGSARSVFRLAYRAKGANATSSALLILTTWYPTHPLRQICRPWGSPPGMPLGGLGLNGAQNLVVRAVMWR
jgi:hypothetical protein